MDPRVTRVGAVARVTIGDEERVRGELEGICGVAALPEGEPGKVAFLIEAQDTDGAHELLTERVPRIAGVLGVWPACVEEGVPPALDEQP